MAARVQSTGSVVCRELGRQVRALRRQANRSASMVAEAAGISGSMLSKIEAGVVNASMTTLAALADALDVPIARFFGGVDRQLDCSVVRAGQGITVQRRGSRSGHSYQLLGAVLTGATFVEPYVVTLTPDATPHQDFQHEGVEFLFMLSGRMQYSYDRESIVIGPGDSLLFDSSALHGPEILMEWPIRYLSICTSLRV